MDLLFLRTVGPLRLTPCSKTVVITPGAPRTVYKNVSLTVGTHETRIVTVLSRPLFSPLCRDLPTPHSTEARTPAFNMLPNAVNKYRLFLSGKSLGSDLFFMRGLELEHSSVQPRASPKKALVWPRRCWKLDRFDLVLRQARTRLECLLLGYSQLSYSIDVINVGPGG